MSNPSNLSQIDPTVPIPQGIYEESTTQLGKLGSKVVVGETTYRYAKAGTNMVAGNVCVIINNTAVNKATVSAAVALGTFEVPIYAAANQSANALADGYLVVKDSTGEGICYRIKSHGALVATTVGQKVVLYDAVASAMGATSVVEVQPNPYANILSGTDVTVTAPVMGVAPVAVTSGNYFFMVTNGPTAVKLGNGTATFGTKLCAGTTGYALAIDATANATAYVGICLGLTGTAYDSVLTWVTAEKGL